MGVEVCKKIFVEEKINNSSFIARTGKWNPWGKQDTGEVVEFNEVGGSTGGGSARGDRERECRTEA